MFGFQCGATSDSFPMSDAKPCGFISFVCHDILPQDVTDLNFKAQQLVLYLHKVP